MNRRVVWIVAAGVGAVLGARIVLVTYRGITVDSEAECLRYPRFLVCRGTVGFGAVQYYYLEEKVSYRGSATGGGSPTKITRHRVVLVTDTRKVTVAFSRRDTQQAFAEHLEAVAGVHRRAHNGRRLSLGLIEARGQGGAMIHTQLRRELGFRANRRRQQTSTLK